MQGYHKPVLLREAIEALRVGDNWYLDATLGDGGHSLEILRQGGKVVGIDVDPQALERAKKRFEDLGIEKDRYKLIQGNFRDIENLIQQMDTSALLSAGADRLKFAGAIFDLGVSSLQLEAPKRGFSFSKVGLLDMRMDPSLQVKALDLINGLNKGELYELFYKLGEEKNSRSLAEALVSARALRPIRTTKELAEVVENVVRRSTKIHPATKIFQALRIAVNDELNALEEGLDQVKDLVQNYGRILVISFHSLEDRITKFAFKKWHKQGLGEILTKKPIRPSEQEVQDNPRSRSAKMRVFEVIKNDNY